MPTIDQWFDDYGESHQNKTNKTIHWICIPLIVFSLLGLLMSIPMPTDWHPMLNPATLVVLLALIFYIRHSFTIFFGFAIVGCAMLYGNYELSVLFAVKFGSAHLPLFIFSMAIFALAWVGQFIGHNIEGAKPSFFKDLQFLLIGPAWLLHFIYKKLGIPYN